MGGPHARWAHLTFMEIFNTVPNSDVYLHGGKHDPARSPLKNVTSRTILGWHRLFPSGLCVHMDLLPKASSLRTCSRIEVLCGFCKEKGCTLARRHPQRTPMHSAQQARLQPRLRETVATGSDEFLDQKSSLEKHTDCASRTMNWHLLLLRTGLPYTPPSTSDGEIIQDIALASPSSQQEPLDMTPRGLLMNSFETFPSSSSEKELLGVTSRGLIKDLLL